MTTAAADYRKLAKRYRTLPETMVRAGAAELRKTTLTKLKRDVGADRILSGTDPQRPRPKPLNVTVKVETGPVDRHRHLPACRGNVGCGRSSKAAPSKGPRPSSRSPEVLTPG